MTNYVWNPDDFAISLARVSDAVQTSIPDQHDMNRSCAEEIVGLPIPEDGYYSDTQSRTLSLAARADFGDAMVRMRDPRCRVMICFDDSRVLGDERQVIEIFERMAANDVRLFWKSGQEQDVKTREGLLTGLIMGWRNKGEVLKTRMRVKETHAAKAKKGRLISRPNYAVRSVPLVEAACGGSCKGDWETCRRNHDAAVGELGSAAYCGGTCGGDWYQCTARHGELSKKNTVFVIDAEELSNLRLMYEYMAKGRTWGELERHLMTLGIRTRVRIIKRSKTNVGKQVGGEVWEKSVIKRVLINPFFRGMNTWQKTEVVREGQERPKLVARPEEDVIHEPHVLGALIPEDLWWQAYEQILRRERTREENAVYGVLLWDGFIWCDRCGRRMSPRRRCGSSAQERYDYHCVKNNAQRIKAKQTGVCPGFHSIPDLALDALLCGVKPAHNRMPDFEVSFTVTRQKADSRPMIEKITRRLSELDGEEERADALVVRGTWTDAKYERQMARINAERERVNTELQRLQEIPDDHVYSTTPLAALAKLAALLRNEAIPVEERRLALTRLVDRIYVDRPRVRFLLREDALQA